MVTGIGWSGEATRFVWNARAQKCGGQVGAPKSEGLSTVTLEIPKNIKFLKTSHRHKHLERGVQNRINESLHQQGYRLAITSIGHGSVQTPETCCTRAPQVRTPAVPALPGHRTDGTVLYEILIGAHTIVT